MLIRFSCRFFLIYSFVGHELMARLIGWMHMKSKLKDKKKQARSFVSVYMRHALPFVCISSMSICLLFRLCIFRRFYFRFIFVKLKKKRSSFACEIPCELARKMWICLKWKFFSCSHRKSCSTGFCLMPIQSEPIPSNSQPT